MTTTHGIILALWLGYGVLLMGFSCKFARRLDSLKSFFLAGRSLGALPVALTFVASWFGAASTMGSVNALHDHGLRGLWDIAIPSVCSCLVITFCFARQVSDYATQTGHLSQPEAVESHYGRAGRFLLALIILASVTVFIGSQMVAAGKLLQGAFGLDFSTATVGITLLVVLYCMAGGYWMVVATDVFQFILFTTAVAILAGWGLLQNVQHPAAFSALLSQQPAAFWNLSHNLGESLSLLVTFVLAWSIAPEMWQRMSSTRTRALAFQAAGGATLCLVGLFVLVGLTGILSAAMVGSSKTVLVDLAFQLPHPALTALVLLGVLAAVTSTMDSSMNIGSLTVTRDLYQGFFRPQGSHGELLWVSRLATALIPLPALFLALNKQDIIEILWMSGDIYASAMFFPVVGLLYCKQPGRWSGILAMVAGGLTAAFSALVQHHWITPPFPWPGWPYSTLVGVSVSGLAFGMGYWLCRKTPERPLREKTMAVETPAEDPSPVLPPR